MWVEDGGIGVKQRRVMAIVFGDCSTSVNGQGEVPVLGLGCFFMTQPTSHAGNTQYVYGQFIEDCEAAGTIEAEAEGLEQLRALHHGMRIRVVEMEGESSPAVDTPEDLERVRALLAPEKGRLD